MNDLTTTPNDGQTELSKEFIEQSVDHLMDLLKRKQEQEKIIRQAKAEIESIKAQGDHLANFVGRNAPDAATAYGLLHTFYWREEGLISGAAITEALAIWGFNRSDLAPGEVPFVTCVSCQCAFTVLANTRTEQTHLKKNGSLCPECRAKREAEEAKQDKEYDRQIKERQAEIARLRSMPYGEYLKTEHWQDVRRRALKRSNFSCQLCNASKTSLHVHHRTYKNRGNEQNSDVIVLCESCHSTFHDKGELSRE